MDESSDFLRCSLHALNIDDDTFASTTNTIFLVVTTFDLSDIHLLVLVTVLKTVSRKIILFQGLGDVKEQSKSYFHMEQEQSKSYFYIKHESDKARRIMLRYI